MLTLCILKSHSCLVLRETLSLEPKERPSVTAAVGLDLDFQVNKNIEFEVPMYPPLRTFSVLIYSQSLLAFGPCEQKVLENPLT